MTRRIVPTMVAVLAISAAVAPGAQAAKRSTLKLALPSPGHVTVAAVSVTVKAGRPARLARHFRVGVKRLHSLPPSVKVLTAQRFIRQKHGGIYSAAVIVVNRAGATAGGAGARSADRPTFLDILFENQDQCDGCGYRFSEDDLSGGLCHGCLFARAMAQSAQAKNVDLLPPASLKPEDDILTRTFTKHGDSDPIFGDPAAGRPPDPSLDTGHYDDGHAFGWNIKTKSEVIDAEHEAIEDILENQPQKILDDLELAAGTDLNGSGQQVNTIVGPPVIT